jgi:hypothetical protein
MRFDFRTAFGFGNVTWSLPRGALHPISHDELKIAFVCHHYAWTLALCDKELAPQIHARVQGYVPAFLEGAFRSPPGKLTLTALR